MTTVADPPFLVDSHAHLQLDPLFGQIGVALNNAVTTRVHAIIVNAVCPGVDWERVETLSSSSLVAQSPLLIPSFGLHPWWIGEMLKATETLPSDSNEAITALCSDIKKQLTQKLIDIPLAGVGECGLDKIIKKTVSLATQESLLRCHLEVAMEYERPASLHCVGAWGRLFDVLMALDAKYRLRTCQDQQEKMGDDPVQAVPLQRSEGLKFVVVLHSCNKMPLDMCSRFQRLRNIPIYYSFNGKQLDDQVGKLLAEIPRDNLLIETDSPDQMPTTISATSTTPSTTMASSTGTASSINIISIPTSRSTAVPATVAPTHPHTFTSAVITSKQMTALSAATASTGITTRSASTTTSPPLSAPTIIHENVPAVQSVTFTPLREVCNQPANIVITCHRVSALLDECSSVIANVTTRNAMLVFAGADF